jgi:hypothetical protein
MLAMDSGEAFDRGDTPRKSAGVGLGWIKGASGEVTNHRSQGWRKGVPEVLARPGRVVWDRPSRLVAWSRPEIDKIGML